MLRPLVLSLLLSICCCTRTISQTMGSPRELHDLLFRLRNSSPDTSRLHILLQLSEFYLFRSDLEGQIDSAEAFLDQAIPLHTKYPIPPLLNHYDNLRAYIRINKAQDIDPQKLYSPLIENCRKQGDKENEKLALEFLVEAIVTNQQTAPVKLAYLEKAIALSRQLHDKAGEMRDLSSIADVHIQQARFDLSDRELSEVLNEPASHEGALITGVNLLSYSYFERGQMDKALQYALKAEKIMEDTGDTLWITNTYNLLYLINTSLGKKDQSIVWSKKALDHYIWTRKTDIIYNICLSIVSGMIEMGQAKDAKKFLDQQIARSPPSKLKDKLLVQKALGNIYNSLKNYPLAEKCYGNMIRYSKEAGSSYAEDDRAGDLRAIGKFYFNIGQYARANEYLDSAITSYERLGRVDMIRSTHLSLYLVDSAMGNFLPAIHHLKEYQRLGDTIFNIARNKQVEEMSIAYQTKQKEKDLAILKEKENLDNIQLRQARTTRDWIIASSIMLLLIAVLLFRQVRLKQKNNRLISHKNELLQQLVTEKEWLLKEVHHRVKNNLHTVISLLRSQAANLGDDALKAIEKSQHRMFAMSMIHQRLYQSDDIRTIDISLYLGEFIQYLSDSFGPPPNVRIRSHIQPLKLDVSQAVPVALIINEAVTNAFKYAFPFDMQGTITIEFSQTGSLMQLTVADDGIGLNQDAILAGAGSMGIQLIKGLTRDLSGESFFETDRGTRITLRFPANPFDTISLSGFSTLSETTPA